MNISKFPVMSTNLFPATNSTAGGQLITEFNLKSLHPVTLVLCLHLWNNGLSVQVSLMYSVGLSQAALL